jgi:hypothetical protein
VGAFVLDPDGNVVELMNHNRRRPYRPFTGSQPNDRGRAVPFG